MRLIALVLVAAALSLALAAGTALAQNKNGSSISGPDAARTLLGTAGSDATTSGSGGGDFLFDDEGGLNNDTRVVGQEDTAFISGRESVFVQ